MHQDRAFIAWHQQRRPSFLSCSSALPQPSDLGRTDKFSTYVASISFSRLSLSLSASTSVTRTSSPRSPSRRVMISLMVFSFSKAEATVGSAAFSAAGAAHGDASKDMLVRADEVWKEERPIEQASLLWRSCFTAFTQLGLWARRVPSSERVVVAVLIPRRPFISSYSGSGS